MVACGWVHTLVRSRNGELWSFGISFFSADTYGAALKLQLGDRGGARELIRESVDMLRRFHPGGRPDVQGVLQWLARCG